MSRLFSDSDTYWVLAVRNKKIIELGYFTAEYFANRKRSMMRSKKYEIKIVQFWKKENEKNEIY